MKANYVTTLWKAVRIQRLLQMQPTNAPFFSVFGGRTATILRGLTFPQILCVPKKAERKKENGHIQGQGFSEGLLKGQVLRRMQSLNWDTAANYTG